MCRFITMSWIRHNVSKTKLQHNAFFKVASQQVQNDVEAINEIVNPPKKTITPEKSYMSNEYDTDSCMTHIDAILYISYDKQKEESIIKEIRKIDPKLKRTLKINAVENENLPLKATQSHILALQEIVKNTAWNNCLILEDGFQFNNTNNSLIHNTITYFINTVKNYDMLLLAANKDDTKVEDTDYAFINKVISTTNKSAYLIPRKYLFKLIGNYIKSSILIKKEGFKEEYAMGNFWEKLYTIDNWYSFTESLGSN